MKVNMTLEVSDIDALSKMYEQLKQAFNRSDDDDPAMRDFKAGGEAIITLGYLFNAIKKITAAGDQPTEREKILLAIYRTAGRDLYNHLEPGTFQDTQYFDLDTDEHIRAALEI